MITGQTGGMTKPMGVTVRIIRCTCKPGQWPCMCEREVRDAPQVSASHQDDIARALGSREWSRGAGWDEGKD